MLVLALLESTIMARQKTQPEPIEEDDELEEEEPKDLPSLTSIVKSALQSLGAHTKIVSVREYITTHYPTLSFNEKTLGTTVSQQRKRMGGAPTLSAVIRAASAEAPPEPTHEPTLKDLLTVLAIAQDEGGVEELRAQIERILELAKAVGGIERLFTCLDGLAKLKG